MAEIVGAFRVERTTMLTAAVQAGEPSRLTRLSDDEFSVMMPDLPLDLDADEEFLRGHFLATKSDAEAERG